MMKLRFIICAPFTLHSSPNPPYPVAHHLFVVQLAVHGGDGLRLWYHVAFRRCVKYHI